MALTATPNVHYRERKINRFVHRGQETGRQGSECRQKGGVDDDADEQVAWVTHIVNEEAKQYKSTYGGCKVVSEVPSDSYIAPGKLVGALPSGQRYGGQRAPGSFNPAIACNDP